MIYPHLPSLKLTEEFIHDLKKFPYKYYVKRKRAKMKFGKKQLNKKGEVKYRITYEPINSLKEKQRGIHEILSQIKLPDSLFGGVKGRNNISNAFQHIESTHFLTIDLRDFFTNVKDVMINEALHLYGYSYNEAVMIIGLCTLNGCLPQGAPSSATLANLVFASTAKILEDFCSQKKIKFTVYIDDLTFSADYDFRRYIKQILDIIRRNGHVPNNQKIHYQRTSCEITGLIIKRGRAAFEKEMLSRVNIPSVRGYVNNVNKHFMQKAAT